MCGIHSLAREVSWHIQYMYMKYFLVILLPLLPNIHNFINWIEIVYGTKENQYVKGGSTESQGGRGLQFMKFDQNVKNEYCLV